MTIPLRPVQYFSYGLSPHTPLERAILKGAQYGTINYRIGEPAEIKAPLHSVSNAIESAYVLTPREALPKVGSVVPGAFGRHFYFTDGRNSISASSSYTSERARKVATSYLAVAAYLEAEESAKEKADAEAAKVAEAAAKNARATRLGELADEYFGEYLEDLSPKKTRAIEAIYDLEQKLADQKDAA